MRKIMIVVLLSTLMVLVSLEPEAQPTKISFSPSGISKTWTCSSGLTCDYQCNGNPYQKMWEGSAATKEYSYSFSAPQTGKYTCTVTVKTCCFGGKETNEVSDVQINGDTTGTTSDQCCPQNCGSESLPNPIEFTLEQGFYDTVGGGLFVHDLDSDGLVDFVFTSEQSGDVGWIQAYDHWGNKMWSKTGIKTFLYMHHPSAIAGDMDGDGKQEVAYLTPSDQIKIVNGATGVVKKTISTGASLNGQPVAGMGIANLRGVGDRDVIVQYKRTNHYSTDPLKAINLETGAVLWTNTNYRGTEHSIFRQADLDGDGRDEVAGVILIDDDGTKMNTWDLQNDMKTNIYGIDSMVIADIYYPGVPYPDPPCQGTCKEVACSYYDNCQSSTGTCPPGEYCCSGACTEPTYDPPTKPVIHSGPSSCDINTICGPFRVSSTQPQGKDIRYYSCRHEYPDDNCWGDLTDHPSGQIVDLYTVFTWEAQHKFGYKVLATSWGGESPQSNRHLIDINDNTGNTRPEKPKFTVTPPSTCVKGQSCGPFSVKSNDPDNDHISYLFQWGDGTHSWNPANPEYETVPSGTTRTRHHIWQETGTYEIKIKTTDLNHGINPYGYNVELITYSSVLSHTVTVTDSGTAGESEVETEKVSFVSASNPLEVVLAETAATNSHTIVVNRDRIILNAPTPWEKDDPDKLAVGEFDTGRAGLEIFCRSSASDGTCDRESVSQYEECPWVHDSQGNVIGKYYLYDVPSRPSWWTNHGIEEVVRIDWDGDAKEEIVGKERHIYGGVAILNPVNGQFKKVWDSNLEAMRVYAADVLGDYREEVIVVDWNGGQGNKVKIFWNSQANSNSKPSYWTFQHYRRQKQNWNYYSP